MTTSGTARHRDKLEELAADLRSTGAEVAVVGVDAADPGQLREALSSLYAAPNPPGVVLYNVARLTPDDLLSAAPEDLLSAYAVNVVGGVVAAQVAVPAMRASGGGTLLFTGGGLADQPHPSLATLSWASWGCAGSRTCWAPSWPPTASGFSPSRSTGRSSRAPRSTPTTSPSGTGGRSTTPSRVSSTSTSTGPEPAPSGPEGQRALDGLLPLGLFPPPGRPHRQVRLSFRG
ncbi:SDR family NAD(P)-dependent oxidoreductase [Streptomyces sp. NPDC054804]